MVLSYFKVLFGARYKEIDVILVQCPFKSNLERSFKSTDFILWYFIHAGASEEIGRKLLDICNGNLEMAIGMQLEGGIDGTRASGSSEALDGASGSSMINDE